jgi:hypothetical protein
MPQSTRRRLVQERLSLVLDTLYRTQQIDRPTRNDLKMMFRDRGLMDYLVNGLYSPRKEVMVPDTQLKIVRLSIKEVGTKQSSLFVMQLSAPADPPTSKSPRRCLVGHRFTQPIEASFRWNLRELFSVFDVAEEYSGFDGAAINIIDDLREKIRTSDFCLFDNRETTAPAKPNVYLEAGMAFALQRPFIFCHYKREVWPSDFSNMVYLSYRNYGELFQELASVLPMFLATRV